MAKIQSRRSISFNREAYDAIAIAASARGVSMAEYLTEALRAYGVAMPETVHATERARIRAVVRRIEARRRRENGWTTP